MKRTAVFTLLASTLLASQAHSATIRALFADQTTDQVLFSTDLNGDGDANDPGEIGVFFDGANNGDLPSPTGNVFAMTQAENGDVYIGDGNSDTVYKLRDRNGDNNAQGASESSVWFSADNAGGLPLQTPNGVAEGGDGAIYVVQADTRGLPTQDVVYRTEDLNGDGDANDPGEATVWLDLKALNPGSSPFEIAFEGDVAYITDTAGGARRIYRAEDTNGDGTIDASEVSNYLGATQPPFAFSVDTDEGNVYALDFLGDTILRYTDLDGNDEIDVTTEAELIWDAVAGNNEGALFDFAIRGNEALVTNNSFGDFRNGIPADDAIFRLVDLNGDGDFLDPGETTNFILNSLQGTYPVRPRSVIYYDHMAVVPLPASAFMLLAALGGFGLLRRSRS